MRIKTAGRTAADALFLFTKILKRIEEIIFKRKNSQIFSIIIIICFFLFLFLLTNTFTTVMTSNRRLVYPACTLGPSATDGRLNPIVVGWFRDSANQSLRSYEFCRFHLLFFMSKKAPSCWCCTCVFESVVFFVFLRNQIISDHQAALNLQQDFLHLRHHLWLALHQGPELNIPSYQEYKVSIYFPFRALLPPFFFFCATASCPRIPRKEYFSRPWKSLRLKNSREWRLCQRSAAAPADNAGTSLAAEQLLCQSV